jgi:hypothetical protein
MKSVQISTSKKGDFGGENPKSKLFGVCVKYLKRMKIYYLIQMGKSPKLN